MEQAKQVYYQMTAEERAREIEWAHKIAQHNEASALRHAQDEERLEIARKMKSMGETVEKINIFTGLPTETIEKIS